MIERALPHKWRRVLPVIHSTEMAECGLACMVMIGNYFGHNLDLQGLRAKFSFSLSGAHVRSLIAIAEYLNLSTRPVRVNLDDLPKLKLPVVLHWDFNHFVVLKSFDGKKAVVHDPALGRVVMLASELSNHFTGVALEFNQSINFEKKIEDRKVQLGSLISNHRLIFVALPSILVVSIFAQVAALAAPWQVQVLLDRVLKGNHIEVLWQITIVFGLVTALQIVLNALRDLALQLLGTTIVFDVVGNVVRHLFRLPSSFFEKRHMADIVSRISAVKNIQEAVVQGLLSTTIDGLVSVGVLTVLFFYSPLLASIVILSLVLVGAVAALFNGSLRRNSEQFITATAKEQSHLMETIRAISTVKLLGRESQREMAWRNLYVNGYNAASRLAKSQTLLTLAQNVLLALQAGAVIFLSVRAVLVSQELTLGMMIAILSFRQTVSDRALAVINKALQFRVLSLHIERLSDIIGTEAEAISPNTEYTCRGGIVMNSVSFKYGDSDPWLLRNINMRINPGEYIAVTGLSGSGKTTLLKLMLGLHKPTNGEIFLDGISADPSIWSRWRSQIGVVAQDDRLFSGSLAENICFFDPDLDMDAIRSAARMAQIDADIMAMPMGYLTLVGDMGSRLSGGQRQRIFLARALYRNPSILVIDEGTANIDQLTEAAICDVVADLKITRIIVAHRPALVRSAHRTWIVKNGEVSENPSAPEFVEFRTLC